MRGRSWAAIGGVFLSLALCSTASAQFSPGARSLGDAYYPNIGNGGLRRAALRRDDQLRPGRALDERRAPRRSRARDAGAVGVLAGLRRLLHGLERQGQRRRRDVHARRRRRDYKYKLVVTPAAGHRQRTRPSTSWSPTAARRRTSSTRTTRSRASCARRPRSARSSSNEPMGAMALVPEQQPPARQGDLRLPPDGAATPTTRRQRRAGVQGRQRRRHDDLELAPRLPDGELPLDSTIGLFDYASDVGRDRASARAASR